MEGLLSVIREIVIATLVVVTAQATAATIQLESAILGPPIPGGQTINETQFVGWRFEIEFTLAISEVGGHLVGNNGGVFAAIVALESITDFPQAGAFTAPDTVGIATPTLPLPSADVLYPLSAILAPGSYALVFGRGEFGATGTGAIVNSAAQTHIDPTTPDSFIFGRRSRPADPLAWQVGPTANMRFVVQGAQIAGTADFETDGDIDADDLAVWQANFGTTDGANITTGSADNDADSDGADFLAWQRQFDSGVPSSVVHDASPSAIPEPVSALLVLLGLLGIGAMDSRRWRPMGESCHD